MTPRFAFYGRVSTEDNQDPTTSKGWQMKRSLDLIEPHGGQVVVEYFDLGVSRSLPWQRRPQALTLLKALEDPRRGFSAIVIGEPQRAFSGNQYSLIFPIIDHYGVELWVPEVGGRVDPDSEAHEMMMNLFGDMSKSERKRIKIRVRSAMAAQALHEGRYLGGRPPYGYQLADVGAHPNPGKAAMGAKLHQLEPDPSAAPMVRRIFAEYLSGKGYLAIAEGLNRESIPCPSAHDPARNRHRSGRGWQKETVRAILGNPKYTGRQVWNRQRRDEVLMDVEDVAAGHQTKLRWNHPSEWMWSPEQMHEPLVSREDFAAVQAQMLASVHRPTPMKGHTTNRHYVLSGRVYCAICERRMQGTWAHDAARYRCSYAKMDDHPKSIYLREDAILPKLDEWLTGLFDDAHLDATCEALAMGGQKDDGAEARAEAARRTIADCDKRLAQYRKALDAGADTVLVASWMSEVQGERLRAEAELGATVPADQLTKAQVRKMVLALRDITAQLAKADPKLRQEVYEELGVNVVYDHDQRVVRVTAGPSPCTTGCVGEGT